MVCKSGLKHRDANCPSRDPVESAPAGDDDDDEDSLLRAVNVDDMAALIRTDFELRALIDCLKGEGSGDYPAFLRALASFAIRQGVVYKKNFGDNHSAYSIW